MSVLDRGEKSWESLSSTLSSLEISLSRDSCYASDDMCTGPSAKPASTDPAAIPLVISSRESSFHRFLKPILKRPYAEVEDDEDKESESGYASDSSEYNPDGLFEETDDEMCDVYDWDDDTSEVMSEFCIDDVESFDGSFISFESSVRFDPNVHYIEAPSYEENESDTTGRTCHEMMEMARASSYPNKSREETYSGAESSDIDDTDHEAISDSIEQLPEHTRDIIDLDKRLFVAYMNGIKGIGKSDYRIRLRSRVADFKSGNVPTPFLDLDSANGMYLDTVLSHVIGTFRNIVVKEEFDELADLSCKESHVCQQRSIVFDKIEHLLSERLANGGVDIGVEELSFFASGVAYALENWKFYASS
ncbi:hypothetical protein BJX61DRAFT_414450 [Aspergillus egyptiacus]|nr:hypothetical protein BJX61DRAFT_414450 [Aspergillus egyptiacus]